VILHLCLNRKKVKKTKGKCLSRGRGKKGGRGKPIVFSSLLRPKRKKNKAAGGGKKWGEDLPFLSGRKGKKEGEKPPARAFPTSRRKGGKANFGGKKKDDRMRLYFFNTPEGGGREERWPIPHSTRRILSGNLSLQTGRKKSHHRVSDAWQYEKRGVRGRRLWGGRKKKKGPSWPLAAAIHPREKRGGKGSPEKKKNRRSSFMAGKKRKRKGKKKK